MNHSDKESIGLFLFETSSYEEGEEEGEGKRYAMLGFPKRFENPPKQNMKWKYIKRGLVLIVICILERNGAWRLVSAKGFDFWVYRSNRIDDDQER